MAKMNPAHGIAFGKEICDIFGLDPSAIHSLRLNIEVDSIVTLEIERYVMQEEATELKRHLDRYDLVASNDARNSA